MAEIINFSEYRPYRSLRKTIAIKKRRKERLKAQQQGHLDGLCGVYCIINAINAVYKLSTKDREGLFKRLILRLEKDRNAAAAIIDGTNRRQLQDMLNETIAYLEKAHGVRIDIKQLFKRGGDVTLTLYWKTTSRYLRTANKRSVIIGIEGREDHWTCIRDMSDFTMNLLDSSGVSRIRRQSCRIGKPYTPKHYHLIATQVWGISFKK